VRSARVDQLPADWTEILRWVSNGEEVEIIDQDRLVARVVPPLRSSPDFLGRARAIWGDHPEGASLSSIVGESRAQS
jgi:antitoxin (DNA-binding transcriptional repressor) of toxin-antitoxin stability system